MNEEVQWQRIIETLVSQVPQLSENFLGRILSDPVYSSSVLTMEDLRESSQLTFEALLESLGQGGAPVARLESIAADLGARRAQQGVPLDSLSGAIRTDFSVLWDALSAPSLGVNPGLLVRRNAMIWRTVDAFGARVQECYRAELEDIERANANLQHQYLTQLLAPTEPTPSDLERIAGALQIRIAAEFLVVAISRDDSLKVQRRLSLGPRRRHLTFIYDQGHHTLIIRQRVQQNRKDLAYDETSLFDGMAAAVAPFADGFASVRSATKAAVEIMTDLPMGSQGIFTLRDRWDSITRHRLAQQGCDPGQLVYPHLRRCTPLERERLLETATVFLASGSLIETAAKLGCHRNTILNRLTAFEKYTGLDVQKPRDAAAAVLALHMGIKTLHTPPGADGVHPHGSVLGV
ncbi:helix-turn-helix domain-containing protein [Arthrobacter sp. CJ23]|uniref:helix-turn-helix domain-containing protein n=1 Tax=Arthrobacter sp. CJ23 TaxID=2972479 RepID=UPI00215B8697|nr:helix-turn-helix domain-containing protein [Arthrobacter sp. CJ23]UVJ40144.1 helix-turn-helix domain-containing protein [Arthrobacter sp. CJ23]